MITTRLTTATATAAVVVLAGSAVALAAGDPTPTPPPKIAVVARGDGTSFADALAVGSVAGQLGAPVFTTPATSLNTATATALTEYAPELVIITGGVAAISAEVEAAIESATGLPDDMVVRAAGADRYETAGEIAAIFDDLGIDAAFLPVGATATDTDLLDGLDSTAFLAADGTAADSDLLDGFDSTELMTEMFETSLADTTSLSGATSTATAKTLLTLDLPAGHYVVTGQISFNAQTTDTSRVVCRTRLGTDSVRAIDRLGGDPGHVGQGTVPIVMTASTDAAETLTLACHAESLTGSAPSASSSHTRLVAIRLPG